MTSKKTFFNLSVEEICSLLNTSPLQGLSADEAKQRLEQYGYNAFEKKKNSSLIEKFFSQFKSFMIIVLLIAAVISGVVGQQSGEGFVDALIILAIVIINAIIGVAQESKAENSLAALEKLSAPQCEVLRDGKSVTIEARELVPGDVVILETGDAVPADLRLIEAVNLKIQEAALTGESVPSDKNTDLILNDVSIGDRDNMAYSSTNVSYGRGVGVVVETGMRTEVGKIASMIQSVPDSKTPMQIRLDDLGKMLAVAALVICVVIFVVGLLQGRELLTMFMTAVSLAAAAIPEGLPAVSTIVLAIGVQRLVKKNAIVRNLPSVETLGSTSVICSDKTGTLTQNKMTVLKIDIDGNTLDAPEELNEEQKLLVTASVLANDAQFTNNETGELIAIGDPTETALLDFGLKYNLNKGKLVGAQARVAEIPFDSERKMMTTIHQSSDSKLIVYTKGGLDEVLACCNRVLRNGVEIPIHDLERKEIISRNEAMAKQALRVLAVGYKSIDQLPKVINSSSIESDFVFIGLLAMMDPPREEVKMAVKECRSAGIKPVMITGDHKITAVAIAEQLGIKATDDIALTGIDVENMSDDELLEKVDHIAVYARVSPEHKVRIVKAFQRKGNVVAMTGDGVNDAPALKLANIGVAMGIVGTDVTKEASDVVLTDDNFATIVTAVSEGRRIYDNILKAVNFLLSTNIGEVLVLLTAMLLGWAVPLLPIQILWINLVTDSLPALALSVDSADKGIMQRKPIDSKQNILTGPFAVRIVLQGIMLAVLSLIAYYIGFSTSSGNVGVGQTMTFAVLAFTQVTHLFNIRSNRNSAFVNMFSNKLLWGAIILASGMMWAVLEIPALQNIFHVEQLTGMQWTWVILLSFFPLVIVEIVKTFLRFSQKRIS